MKRRISIILLVIILILATAFAVWWFKHRRIGADVTTSQTSVLEKIPKAVIFTGKITGSSIIPAQLLIILNGNAFSPSADGKFTITIPRSFFTVNKKVQSRISVEFWDPKTQTTYVEKNTAESFRLMLPDVWRDANMTVNVASNSAPYTPPPSFYVQKNFDLVPSK